jgi:hypothetical protein
MTDLRHLIILPLCGLFAACGGGGAAPIDAVSAPPPLPQDEAPAPPSAPGDETTPLPPDPQDETPPDPPVDPEVPTITLEPRASWIAWKFRMPPSAAPANPEYEPRTDTIIIRDEALQRVVDNLMPAGFAAYDNGTPSIRGVRGETGGGAAFVVRREGVEYFGRYERFGNTELPTLGSGTFTGTYAGTLGTRNAENRGTIVGNALFEVDFGEREISGVIDGRVNQNSRDFDDLTLQRAELRDDGSFQARISGGQSPFLGHTETSGRYNGYVVGQAGDGLVGILQLDHSGAPTFVDLVETGAFVAERQ